MIKKCLIKINNVYVWMNISKIYVLNCIIVFVILEFVIFVNIWGKVGFIS